VVVGGGSRNKLWRRIVADAFQLPLRFPAEPEVAALGAALQAAAVHSGVPVADYVERHPPPMGEPAWGGLGGVECQLAAASCVARAMAGGGQADSSTVAVSGSISSRQQPGRQHAWISVLCAAQWCPCAEAEVLHPAHEAAEAYKAAFQRHQKWGACLFGGGSCDI
jgi:hypothetical protein